MAIAYDNVTANEQLSGSSLTFAHTTSGSDTLLFAGTTDGGAVGVSSITYNSVSASLVGNVQIPSDRSIFLYSLIAPANGSNNIVFTLNSSTTNWGGTVITYTGCDQTTNPEASGTDTASGVTSDTTSLTTLTDDAWLTAQCGYTHGTWSASSGTTQRANPAGSSGYVDSGGSVGTAGSYSLGQQTTRPGGTNFAMVIAAIKPAAAASSNIKSIAGVAKANIKSVAGLTLG